MVGIELVSTDTAGVVHPNPQAVKAVLSAALSEGLIVLSAGSVGQVIRLIPPLITTSSEVQFAVDAITRAILSSQ
jgi:diaminobutyrate-2-oxoglutarate transaminase